MKRSVLLVGVLALASISIAYSKAYSISFSRTTKVGSEQLKAGSYEIKLDGDKAVFTDVASSKKTTVPVKVENGTKKFDYTKSETSGDGNVDTLKDIQLGGSTTQLDF
jgi:hypothetical protein